MVHWNLFINPPPAQVQTAVHLKQFKFKPFQAETAEVQPALTAHVQITQIHIPVSSGHSPPPSRQEAMMHWNLFISPPPAQVQKAQQLKLNNFKFKLLKFDLLQQLRFKLHKYTWWQKKCNVLKLSTLDSIN